MNMNKCCSCEWGINYAKCSRVALIAAYCGCDPVSREVAAACRAYHELITLSLY